MSAGEHRAPGVTRRAAWGNLGGVDSAPELIASKVVNPVGDSPNDRGLSRRHFLRQVEASLRRLGLGHLDMYQIHEPDPATPLEGTRRAPGRPGTQRRGPLSGGFEHAGLARRPLGTSASEGPHRFEWVQRLL